MMYEGGNLGCVIERKGKKRINEEEAREKKTTTDGRALFVSFLACHTHPLLPPPPSTKEEKNGGGMAAVAVPQIINESVGGTSLSRGKVSPCRLNHGVENSND